MLAASEPLIAFDSFAEQESSVPVNDKDLRRASGSSAGGKRQRKRHHSKGKRASTRARNSVGDSPKVALEINEEDVVFAGPMTEREKQVISERGLADSRRRTIIVAASSSSSGNNNSDSRWVSHFKSGFQKMTRSIIKFQGAWRVRRQSALLSLKRMRAAFIIGKACRVFLAVKRKREEARVRAINI